MIRFAHRSISISPSQPVPLAGKGGRSRVSTCLHDDLEANIVVVGDGPRRIVVISLDSLFVGSRVTRKSLELCADAGVPAERVLICASHTHSAPALEDTKPLLGAYDTRHGEEIEHRLSVALRALLRDDGQIGTPSIGTDRTSAGMNRRLPWPVHLTRRGLRFRETVMAPNPLGPTDPQVTAVVIRGKQPAVLWHYTCHPTAFPYDKQVSADYPGLVRAALRKALGPTTTIAFLQGFAGDIRPPSGRAHGGISRALNLVLRGPQFDPLTLDEWTAWGKTIADAAVRAASNAAVAKPEIGLAEHAMVPLDRLLRGASKTRPIEMQQIQLFGLRIVAVSAEPLVGLKELVSPGSLCVGYSRDVFGYWPRTSELPSGGYEVNEFKRVFGVDRPWCPDPDGVFKELLDRSERLVS